jgi:hypothetical protein
MIKSPRSFVWLLACVVAFGAAPLEAKGGGRLAGKVKTVGGEALIGAVITIFRPDGDGGTLFFTRSDRTGTYNFADVAPGSYFLQVTRDGYQPLTTSNVKVDGGKTTGFDIILQEFFGLISDDTDPRNRDLKTVLRSASGRRLIFRGLPGVAPYDTETQFYRSGAMNVSSNANLASENSSVLPGQTRNGVLSNFAYTEPVSSNARMIFSGQLNSGSDSYWRVRNTYNYHPNEGRDLRFSVGYGRLNLSRPTMGELGRPAQFFAQDPELRESAVQTVLLGFEGQSKFLDILELGYGFDYACLYYGTAKSVFSPYFRISVSPVPTWLVSTSLQSRRMTDDSSITLPGNERLDLSEPAYLTRVGDRLSLSQVKHSELAITKSIEDDTSVEVAAYEDRTEGPGMPFLLTSRSAEGANSSLARLNGDLERGLRLVVDRKIFDFLSGSIAYVYGGGTGLASGAASVSNEQLAHNLLQYMQHSYYHSITSQLHAEIPWSRTSFTSVVRWYPGNPVTSLDPFADRLDIMTKGVSFLVRQGIPLPDFMGTAGRWEALVDIRNLFDQGRSQVRTTDGELLLTRNPRTLRFGLNLNFY